MQKNLDVSYGVSSIISILIGIAVLVGWLITDEEWTWVNYLALVFAIYLGLVGSWFIFRVVLRRRW